MRLIDADAFKEYIRGACEEMSHVYKDGGKWAKQITEDFCMDIDDQPTIESNRKTGHWILHPEQEKNIFCVKTIECSECGDKYLVQFVDKEKYCRNCGAKMERKE